jgi:hypothetical protein
MSGGIIGKKDSTLKSLSWDDNIKIGLKEIG